MLHPTFSDTWPDFWKEAYLWDDLELWGSRKDLGYAYAYHYRRDPVLTAVEALVPKGGLILDVAAANGNFTLPLAEKGYRVTWNDIRPDLIAWVKQKYEFGDVDYVPGNVFDHADAWENRFDAVIATECLEHVAHPDQFLAVLAKVIRPGGLVFLTTPNGKYFRNKLPKFSEFENASVFEGRQFGPASEDHIFLLHPEELVSMGKQAGLEVEHFTIVINPLTCGHVKLGHLLPLLPRALVSSVERLTQKLPAFMRDRLHTNSAVIYRKS